MHQQASNEYAARLNRVLDYIHEHLDQALTLEALAEVAGFSPYHFHRLFKSLVRETLGGYIWRIRLERAANLLTYHPEIPVLEIALCCGFSGPAVLSRAFRERFQMTPSQYRKLSKGERNPGKDTGAAESYNGKDVIHFQFERSELPMEIEVKNLPTFHVAYIRHLEGYRKGEISGAINTAFQRVCSWAAARDLFQSDTRVIGIPYDNPDVTPTDRCRYDACVTVPADVTEGTGEVGIGDISGGKYAVGHIETSAQEAFKIGEMVDQMYAGWLPGSGFTVDDKPALEIYYDSPGKPHGTWISMDYCIPIRPV